MATKFVQEQIRDQVLERLRSYEIGDRLPSDRHLAKEFGVAFLTINRLMSQLSNEGYVERRPRSGTFLASRERTTAHDHFSGSKQNGSIICACPNYFSYSIWKRLQLLEQGAVHRGIGYVEYRINQNGTYENLINFAKERGDTNGLILMPLGSTLSDEQLETLASLEKPVVLLDHGTPALQHNSIHAVSCDWHRMGYLKIQAMLEAGHRHLCFIAHDPKGLGQDKQIAGMRQAIEDLNIPGVTLHIQGSGIDSWQDARQAAYELTIKALHARSRHHSSGFIYGSYGGVTGGLRACHELHLSVPEDVSIIATGKGNGDEDFERPRISTVTSQLDIEIETCFERLQHGWHEAMTLYYPHIIKRDSIREMEHSHA